jgi:hypothetical protein
MRFRIPRFHLRTLLIVMAITGLAFGGEVMRRRRVRWFSQAASRYYSREQNLRESLDVAESRLCAFRDRYSAAKGEGQDASKLRRLVIVAEGIIATLRKKLAHDVMMRSKYERAACYPWFPVEPDLPEPE